MINFVKRIWNKYMHSLRAGMLTAIIAAVLLGITVYLLMHTIFINWVENDYNSDESRTERYEEYLYDLRDYVKRNEVSSRDTSEITRWVRSNRNVYVFLYKDNLLFYDSSINDTDRDNGTGDYEGGDADGDNTEPGDPSVGDDEGENSARPEEDRPNSGITVDFPTREEIIANAGKNGLEPIDFSDGTLLVSLVDFTEYIYYDVANIASLVAAFIALTAVLMLYFHNITAKISRLAQDVSTVYEVDMSTEIRTGKGNDELSELTRNVERMRSTMLASLENEKAALNANSELITSMSHDIRTPLTVLLGYIDIMKSRECDDVMKEYLRASESTAMRLKELSDDLFRYFLIFGGDLKPELVDYDVKTLMDQLLTEHVLLLGERGYNVSLHTSKSLREGLLVTTDAPKLMRVVDNLFSNIYKYADTEKTITVAAGITASGKVRIAIKNFIAKSADSKESNRIGLKTCKKLCDALGAGFEYTIDNQNGTDIFTAVIDLPVAREVEEG